jgi:Fur family transcriptional regulator, ferric uptake regulator
MGEIHSHERRQFEKLFKQEKIDRFDDRFKVLEVFLQIEQHVTVEDMAVILKDRKPPLSEGFIKETLELMCLFGFAQKNRFKNGDVYYEHRHLGQHHDHMICTKCGKIIEFVNDQLEQIQSQVASGFGFHMLQHRMEIYGICGDCLKSREQFMPLLSAKQGERVIIKDFIGGNKARMRLSSMGLRIGDEIEVVTNNGQGQMVVAVDFQRYVFGRGMSQKIIVGQKES